MYAETFFLKALIYLAAAVISVPLAKRLGLGSVLGYLLAGMVLGPFGLHLIGKEGHDVMHFAEFGVVMMLFLIGLELEPRRLWSLRRSILGLGGTQVVATSLLGALALRLFGLQWPMAIAVSMIVALSSTALVLQTLNEKFLLRTDAGQNVFTVLLFQDIAVIPMLALLPLFATLPGPMGGNDHGSASWVEGLPGWAQTLVVLVIMGIIVIGGRYLTRPIFRYIARARLREIFTSAALLLVIGTALLMTRIGLSPALGTFLAGVVLANNEYRHELESNIEPFKGLLLGVFFIAVGASLDFQLVLNAPLLIIGLVIALIVIKMVILFGLGFLFKMGLDQNLIFTVLLAQGGEFAFVLTSFAVQSGVVPTDIANLLVAVVAVSMALTPLLILLNERLLLPRFGTRLADERSPDVIDEQNPVIIAGFNNFGSIIGRLLRANHIDTTVLEYDSDHVETLRKLGFKVYYGDASQVPLLHAAGAENARYIIITVRNPEKTHQIVDAVQQNFPHLKILARALSRTHAYELMDKGVHHVYRDSLETSLRVGVDTLRLMGFRAHQAHRASALFRKHDEAMTRELATLFHDRTSYLNRAREAIFELEQLLRRDHQEPSEERDAGWDVASMQQEARRRREESK